MAALTSRDLMLRWPTRTLGFCNGQRKFQCYVCNYTQTWGDRLVVKGSVVFPLTWWLAMTALLLFQLLTILTAAIVHPQRMSAYWQISHQLIMRITIQPPQFSSLVFELKLTQTQRQFNSTQQHEVPPHNPPSHPARPLHARSTAHTHEHLLGRSGHLRRRWRCDSHHQCPCTRPLPRLSFQS